MTTKPAPRGLFLSEKSLRKPLTFPERMLSLQPREQNNRRAEMTANQTTIANVPSCNIRRFADLALAISYAGRMNHHTKILMGDDGRYWIASTNRETFRLMAAGYEAIR
jgi:hypothetical protein